MARKNLSSGQLIIGILLIAVGALFLLDNFYIIDFYLPPYLFSWKSILIIIGLLLLANSESKGTGIVLVLIGLIGFFPEFWPLILVGLGGYIIIRNKSGTHAVVDEDSNQYFNELSIFGGSNKNFSIKDLKGGKITSIFGGSELYFHDCTLAEGKNVIDLFFMFGGSTLFVPKDWNVQNEVLSLFGGFSDKRRSDPRMVPDPERTLVVKGLIIFGGGEIKS